MRRGGKFDMKWIRLTLFTEEDLQKLLKVKIKPLIDRLKKNNIIETFYFFQYPQEKKISLNIQGETEKIQKGIEEFLKTIRFDEKRTEIINPYDVENDKGEIEKFKDKWSSVRRLFELGSEMALRYMDKLEQKVNFQEVTIHTFLQNLNYNSIEEMEIGTKVILGRKDDFKKKERWNLLINTIIEKLEDSKNSSLKGHKINL